MEIFKKITSLRAFLQGIKEPGRTIGLVPTMGALHNGHLALIHVCKTQNALTVCSIYVNPTQFNNAVDLQKYPRNLENDLQLLKEAECDVVFCPETEEMYTNNSSLKFDIGGLHEVMEGKFRPNHFNGVALIVSKLFNIVQPNNSYFGQKDWQQFAVIQQLVNELKFNVKVHVVPTLREPDGLAMSSRNERLEVNQRLKATIFYKALLDAKKDLKEGKEISFVRNKVKSLVEKQEGIVLEYFEVAESKNLNVLNIVKGAEKPIMCIAGYVGEVRLIDNMFLD